MINIYDVAIIYLQMLNYYIFIYHILLIIIIIYVSHNIINVKESKIRSIITKHFLWKLQFFFHPIIVYYFILNNNVLNSLIFIPFLFNFGVEPWDLPNDLIFNIFFYCHHIAPLLLCIYNILLQIEINYSNLIAQAILFSHAWLLHSIGNLDHLKVINKQKWFWQYMFIGFILKCYWWHSFYNKDIISYDKAPIFIQYIGRWGLYIRIMKLIKNKEIENNINNIKNNVVNIDKFENSKQRIELISFILSYIFVYFYK
jgi:hypothetical protein